MNNNNLNNHNNQNNYNNHNNNYKIIVKERLEILGNKILVHLIILKGLISLLLTMFRIMGINVRKLGIVN